jgi:hypothetical protein
LPVKNLPAFPQGMERFLRSFNRVLKNRLRSDNPFLTKMEQDRYEKNQVLDRL